MEMTIRASMRECVGTKTNRLTQRGRMRIVALARKPFSVSLTGLVASMAIFVAYLEKTMSIARSD